MEFTMADDDGWAIEKKKQFIIKFIYFFILFVAGFLVLKYALPMLTPFVIAFLIAWTLKRPIRFLSSRLHINTKATAIVMVLLFYSTIGVLLSLLGIKAFAAIKELVLNLPGIYTGRIEPVLMELFDTIDRSSLRMDPTLVATMEEMFNQFVQSLGQMVSSLSMGAMGSISGLASSLPALFIKLLLMIISTFFIAADYDCLTGFCMRQLEPKATHIFLQIKEYVIGTLFVCIRSYALIMSITFVELSIGLTLIGVPGSVPIALMISIFDVLPVLGTGGIMIPWVILTALQGKFALAFGLLAVYLFITVVRNILEPKIVGSQIGLHPVVTLTSMFVGSQLLGLLGLFGFPIALSLLCHLNDNGTIKLFHLHG